MRLQRSDAHAMVWNWAAAEVDSPRFGPLYAALPAAILQALRHGKPGDLSAAEWIALAAAVEGIRGPLLAGLLRLGTDWHAGMVVSSALLEQLRLVWFHAAVPSRHLSALVDLLDAGREIPGEEQLPAERRFAPNYRTARAVLDVEHLRAAPILVAERTEGPYGILEGYTRLAVLLSRVRAGAALPAVPVVVGVCARIGEWRLHDNPAGMPLFWQ